MTLQVFDASRDAGGGYKVDLSRGERVGPGGWMKNQW
jgi:hypothetical protein